MSSRVDALEDWGLQLQAMMQVSTSGSLSGTGEAKDAHKGRASRRGVTRAGARAPDRANAVWVG